MSDASEKQIARGKAWANCPGRTVLRPAVTAIARPPFPGLLLALGDSWLNYFPPFDVLVALNKVYGYGTQSVAIPGARLASIAPPPDWNPGQSIKPTNHGDQLDALAEVMRGLGNADKQTVKAILLSGGGDDIVGNGDGNTPSELNRLLNDADQGPPAIDPVKFDQLVNVGLRDVLAEVLSATTELSEKYLRRPVPILIHGYGHPVPDGRGAQGKPWLQPVMNAKHYIDLQTGTNIMSDLIDGLNDMQVILLVDNPDGFAHVKHVDVRPVLSNRLPEAYRIDWQNELHPTIPHGFSEVARLFQAALKDV